MPGSMELTAKDDGTFDVTGAIDSFLGDESRVSLEFPPTLTAEQRKQVKRLADQHKNLKAESYGFGADRKLLLYKQEGGLGTVAESSPVSRLPEAFSPVRVKNTFIDDFMSEVQNGEGAHMRTLPDRLPPSFFKDDPPLFTPPRISEKASPTLASPPLERQSPQPAPIQRPPPISSESSGGGSPSPPALPEGFRFTVRDTFIHIENEDQQMPERIVQTLPPNMNFVQAIEAERRATASKAAAPPPPSTAPPAAPPSAPPPAGVWNEQLTYAPGDAVIVEGLLKLPAFNGRTGTVDSLDAETGRYNVLLDSQAGDGAAKWAKVKGDNLRPRLPAPPQFLPTFAVEHEAPPEPACLLSTPGGSAIGFMPPTPKWEDSFAVGHLSAGGLSTTPLRLDSLL